MEKIYKRCDIKNIDNILYSNTSTGDGYSINSLIDSLEKLKERYESDGWKDLRIKAFIDYEYTGFNLTGMRIETDKELELRKKSEQKKIERQKIKAEKEIRKLKELQRKYPNVI